MHPTVSMLESEDDDETKSMNPGMGGGSL